MNQQSKYAPPVQEVWCSAKSDTSNKTIISKKALDEAVANNFQYIIRIELRSGMNYAALPDMMCF